METRSNHVLVGAVVLILIAVLALFFITGGERFRARLHLSILDEVPTLISRLLMSAALVATYLSFHHPHTASTVNFLTNAAFAVVLVVAGRMVTTSLVASVFVSVSTASAWVWSTNRAGRIAWRSRRPALRRHDGTEIERIMSRPSLNGACDPWRHFGPNAVPRQGTRVPRLGTPGRARTAARGM